MSRRGFSPWPARLVTVLAITVLASVLGPAAPAAAAPYRTEPLDLAALGWDQLSWHDDVVPGFPAKPPTDAEGLVLSFFVRLHRVTGDSKHLDAATLVFRSFKRLGREQSPWVGYVDDAGYLWLEHYPSHRADHVLNAHLHALFGLHDYWQETRSSSARTLLEGATLTMRDNVALYRERRGVSIYCLYHRSQHRKYHAIHIWQLHQLGRLSGDDHFAAMADRFERDYTPEKDGLGKPRS